MSVTTKDCVNKLVEFFQAEQGKQEIIRLFGFDEPKYYDEPAKEEALKWVTDPKRWKRRYKISPTSPKYDEVGYNWRDNEYVTLERRSINPNDVAFERGFDCDGFDGQVAYMVLELKDGTIEIGDYIGD